MFVFSGIWPERSIKGTFVCQLFVNFSSKDQNVVVRFGKKSALLPFSNHCNACIRLAQVGYIKLFIICFISLDISLLSFILIVNVWLV